MCPPTSTIIFKIYPPTPPNQPSLRPPVSDLLIIGEKYGSRGLELTELKDARAPPDESSSREPGTDQSLRRMRNRD
jgi:hypothetical protein